MTNIIRYYKARIIIYSTLIYFVSIAPPLVPANHEEPSRNFLVTRVTFDRKSDSKSASSLLFVQLLLISPQNACRSVQCFNNFSTSEIVLFISFSCIFFYECLSRLITKIYRLKF